MKNSEDKLYNTFMKKIVLAVFLVISVSAVNYQERGIYYNDYDYACLDHDILDYVIVNVKVDGKTVIREKVWGGTLCRQGYVRPENILSPGRIWGYIDNTERTFIKI